MSSAGTPRILAGRYRLGEVIGRGGMSTVYRATDLSLDRVVAVKVALDPMAEENPVYVARFKREARAAAALDDPGVATIFDAGSDGPTRYIVMEFVDGRSLSEILRDDGPLESPRAAHIAERVADTLAAAHAAGIVHRDIKPGNIMVTADDHVKVLDFGIARTADAVTLTQTASILGTAPYMAPEQAMGNPADARSDIYSLGCVLYEMLTGQPPFMADVPAAVLHQHVRVPVKPPGERNPEVAPALDALVVQMLAKNPDDRPQTAAEVRDRLTAFITGSATAPTRPIAAVEAPAMAADAPQATPVPPPAFDLPPVAPPPRMTPPAATAATRTLSPSPPPSPRRGAGLWVALAVIAVVLLGAGVAFALAGGGSSTTGTTDSHASSHTTTPATSAATSTPHSTSTSSSTSTPTSTTSTTTTTTTTSSTPTTTSSTPTTTVTSPGQGGTPPGQAKKSTTTQ